MHTVLVPYFVRGYLNDCVRLCDEALHLSGAACAAGCPRSTGIAQTPCCNMNHLSCTGHTTWPNGADLPSADCDELLDDCLFTTDDGHDVTWGKELLGWQMKVREF
eukprot:1090638-Amphidinium_carterae.1